MQGTRGFDPWPGNIPHAVEQLSHTPQLLNPGATTTEAGVPRAHALQQEKPLPWEACAPQQRAAPARCN